MEWITALVIALIVTVLAYGLSLLGNSSSKYENLPPGPPRWPLLGNIPLLLFSGQRLEGLTKNLCKKYGGMVTVWFGPMPIIFVGDADICRDALVNNAAHFSNRLSTRMIKDLSDSYSGIVFAPYGKELTAKRKWSHQAMKVLLFDQDSTKKDIIKEECKELVRRLSVSAASGEPTDLKDAISRHVIVITSCACFGKEFASRDENIREVRKMLYCAFVGGTSSLFLVHSLFPFLSNVPAFGLNLLRKYKQSINKLVQAETAKRDKEDSFTDDLLGHFAESSALSDPHDVKTSFLQDDHEKQRIVGDLFVAGSETSSNTLLWCILILAKYPDLQQSARTEVERVSDSHKGIENTAINDFPYLRAFMSETFRFVTVAPLPVLHVTSDDARFHGYNIPKGTVFLPNLNAMHHDANVWDKPGSFCPQRFLKDDGSFFIPNRSFLPFSVGARVCVGDHVAKKEIVFTMAYLLLAFNILQSKEGIHELEDDGLKSVLSPKPYKVILQSRDVTIA